jgi:beta-glucosidase/6-phospho-beta-glucosidase/beta-galactosidase
VSAVKGYASWGFFDFRRKDESFENGYQSVPVDWGINSERKREFFNFVREITGK